MPSVISPQSRHSHAYTMWHVVVEQGGGMTSVLTVGTIVTVFRFVPPHEPHLSGVWRTVSSAFRLADTPLCPACRPRLPVGFFFFRSSC